MDCFTGTLGQAVSGSWIQREVGWEALLQRPRAGGGHVSQPDASVARRKKEGQALCGRLALAAVT